MLKNLTEDQEKLIDVVADKWLNKFYSCAPINEEKAKEYVNFAYELSKLKPPSQIIFAKSPLHAQEIVHELEPGSCRVLEQIWSKVFSTVRKKAFYKFPEKISRTVLNKVKSDVFNKVWDNVWDKVWDKVWIKISNKIYLKISSRVSSKLLSIVLSKLWEKLSDKVLSETEYYFHSDFGLAQCIKDAALYDYFDQIGVLDDPNFRKYRDLLFDSNVYEVFCFKNQVIVVPLPLEIHVDEAGNLHNENGPAIKWDGFEINFKK